VKPKPIEVFEMKRKIKKNSAVTATTSSDKTSFGSPKLRTPLVSKISETAPQSLSERANALLKRMRELRPYFRSLIPREVVDSSKNSIVIRSKRASKAEFLSENDMELVRELGESANKKDCHMYIIKISKLAIAMDKELMPYNLHQIELHKKLNTYDSRVISVCDDLNIVSALSNARDAVEGSRRVHRTSREQDGSISEYSVASESNLKRSDALEKIRVEAFGAATGAKPEYGNGVY
jgi:hypothetical protein